MSRLTLMLLTSSATLLVFGLWIPLKAVLAQEMLELAWAESQARQTQSRPWPWADTWPVARLAIPELKDSMIVLEGASGESLAFGPGRLAGLEGNQRVVVIAGHRDTHFRRLETLEAGNEIRLQSRQGRWRSYRVENTRVVDSRVELINTRQLPDGTLLLVTCYPFNSVEAGGPLRYVVQARATDTGGALEQIDTVAGL